MVSVSFGVLFALWISQWQESEKQKKEVATALEFIVNEIKQNNNLLTSRIA